MTCVVYISNTNIVELSGLKSALEDEFIDDATVTLTVKDVAGVEIEGQEWPWTMTPVGVTDATGDYRAILQDTVEFVAGTTYYAHIDADAGPDRIGHWEFAFIPKVRRGS